MCDFPAARENETLLERLNASFPDYLPLVPALWLEGVAPSHAFNLGVAGVFGAFCAVNNVCSVLLFLVFARCMGMGFIYFLLFGAPILSF